jgi:hypothetical protein
MVETNHGLYTEKGEMLLRFDKFPYVLGKRKEDVDYVLEIIRRAVYMPAFWKKRMEYTWRT